MLYDIALDAVGSDNAPEPEIRGAILACRTLPVRVETIDLDSSEPGTTTECVRVSPDGNRAYVGVNGPSGGRIRGPIVVVRSAAGPTFKLRTASARRRRNLPSS